MTSTITNLSDFLLVQSRQAISLVRLMRLQPLDTSTPEGRSHERYRRIILTAIVSVIARGISILTSLISVPLTVGYLGSERYGLWMTMSSVITMLAFTDLGIGNGLLNAISEANGRDDREMARRSISSAFFMLSAVALTLAIGFALIYPRISWQRLFNVSSPQAVSEAGPAMVVFITCFLLNIPLGIINRVQMGYQEGFTNSVWSGVGNLLSLIGVLLAIHQQAELAWLVLAMAGAPVIATLLNGAVLFGHQRPWLRPSWRSATSETARKLLHLGLLFFVLQVAVALAYSSDNIIIAQILGPEAVTQYAIPVKLFSFAPLILNMALMPLWPAYGEAIARNDTAWVKKTLSRSLFLTLLITGLPSGFIVLFGKPIVQLWVGTVVTPSFLLLLGFGVWTVLMSAGNAVAMFLNGANVVRFQMICALLMSTSAILGKILLTQRVGLPGVIWGTIIAYTLFAAIPYAILVPKILSAINQKTGRQ